MSKHNHGHLCFLSVFPVGHRIYHSRDDQRTVVSRGINNNERQQLKGFCVAAKVGYYTQVGELVVIKVEESENEHEQQDDDDL